MPNYSNAHYKIQKTQTEMTLTIVSLLPFQYRFLIQLFNLMYTVCKGWLALCVVSCSIGAPFQFRQYTVGWYSLSCAKFGSICFTSSRLWEIPLNGFRTQPKDLLNQNVGYCQWLKRTVHQKTICYHLPTLYNLLSFTHMLFQERKCL